MCSSRTLYLHSLAAYLSLGVALLVPLESWAIAFENVSAQAGFREVGPTSGSAWGDFNKDGWPDLWVSNHHGKPPTLYLNKRDGRFEDVTHTLNVYSDYSEHDWPDYHGGAWADIDNDGDLDFLVITGGGAGRGTSASHFFQNAGDQGFIERGAALGLNYPLGRGRTPQWLDVNNDAKLDVVVMNKHRKTAPSTLFVQQADGTFENQSGLPVIKPGFVESVWLDLLTWLNGPPSTLTSNAEFAQLSMLPVGNRASPVLVAYEQPTRLFQWSDGKFTPLGTELPAVKGVQDAVIADFDNDGINDWLLIRSRPGVQEVRSTGATGLVANFAGTVEKPKKLQIETAGDIEVHYHRVWMDPTDPRLNEILPLYLGNTKTSLKDQIVELSTQTNSLHVQAPNELPERAVSVDYNPATNVWTLKNTSGPLNIEVTSTKQIEDWQTEGFQSSTGELTDAIVFNHESGIGHNVQELASSPCQAAAAADFDNDGDIDIYLLCATPADNAPDRLWENQGDGTFSETQLPSQPGRGSQVATADFDNDGFVDLALTNGAGPLPFAELGQHTLLRNVGNDNQWLQLNLIGTQSNRDGIGALIEVRTANGLQTKVQGSNMHSLSQNDSRLHFGLGKLKIVESIQIRWPSGIVQTLENVASNQIVDITEP